MHLSEVLDKTGDCHHHPRLLSSAPVDPGLHRANCSRPFATATDNKKTPTESPSIPACSTVDCTSRTELYLIRSVLELAHGDALKHRNHLPLTYCINSSVGMSNLTLSSSKIENRKASPSQSKHRANTIFRRSVPLGLKIMRSDWLDKKNLIGDWISSTSLGSRVAAEKDSAN